MGTQELAGVLRPRSRRLACAARAHPRALADGPLSIDELAGAVVADGRFAHLRDALLDESRTIFKPFAWQGDFSLGPTRYWLTQGLSAGKKRVDGWLTAMADSLTVVDLEGDRALCLTEFVDDLNATAPATDELRLAGHDPWVRGPGTADQRVVPRGLRPLATRGAKLVLHGGRVSGSW